MSQSIQKCANNVLWKTVFKKFEGVWSTLGRQCPFKFLKGCRQHFFCFFRECFDSYIMSYR